MDSGATDHIFKTCPTPNGKCSKYTFVELPNGGKTKIDLVGIMKLSNDLILKYVLYVLEFNVNLLSISKLTQALGCSETFYHDYCVDGLI